jgi:actin-related protein 8
MASTYLKTEAQTWLGRQAPAPPLGQGVVPSRGRKRKRPEATNARVAEDDEEEEGDESGSETDVSNLLAERQTLRLTLWQAAANPAQRTLVIHPSTSFLRIGLASDLYPLTVPNVVARRDREGAPPRPARASASPEEEDGVEEAEVEEEDAEEEDADGKRKKKKDPVSAPSRRARTLRLTLSQLTVKIDVLRADLRSIMRAMKLRPVTNGRGLAAAYNETSRAEKVPEHNDVMGVEWTKTAASDPDVLLGERALRLPAFSGEAQSASRPWELFYPFRQGRLDIEPYVARYGSAAAQALLSDVRAILMRAITAPREDLEARDDAAGPPDYGLGIDAKELGTYSVILIVSDLYSATDIQDLTDLLLVDMGFQAICIQQESVSATFGAGLSSGCVVRIGRDHTAVTCVDEGLVLAESRIGLAYGGDDVSLFFAQLLRAANCAYKELDFSRRLADRWIVEDLKHRLLTLDATQLGLVISDFHVRLPGRPTLKYQVRTYDEVILAPMLLFSPRVVSFKGKRSYAARLGGGLNQAEREDGERGALGTGADLPVTAAMQGSVSHLLPAAPDAAAADATPAPAAQAATNGTAAAGREAGASPHPVSLPPGMEQLALPDFHARMAAASAAGGSTGSPIKNEISSGTAGPSRALTPARTAGESTRPSPSAGGARGPSATPLALPSIDVQWEAAKVPLDVAVWNSIRAAVQPQMTTSAQEERVKRMSNNIICIGGTAQLPGLGSVLEAR